MKNQDILDRKRVYKEFEFMMNYSPFWGLIVGYLFGGLIVGYLIWLIGMKELFRMIKGDVE